MAVHCIVFAATEPKVSSTRVRLTWQGAGRQQALRWGFCRVRLLCDLLLLRSRRGRPMTSRIGSIAVPRVHVACSEEPTGAFLPTPASAPLNGALRCLCRRSARGGRLGMSLHRCWLWLGRRCPVSERCFRRPAIVRCVANLLRVPWSHIMGLGLGMVCAESPRAQPSLLGLPTWSLQLSLIHI